MNKIPEVPEGYYWVWIKTNIPLAEPYLDIVEIQHCLYNTGERELYIMRFGDEQELSLDQIEIIEQVKEPKNVYVRLLNPQDTPGSHNDGAKSQADGAEQGKGKPPS